ncbi:3-hydroxyacyl-CoA dehydrogenase NAD-binding domain-containing protein [Acinetobacter rathckeae]|uniref:3-hydroxyacyl-CoA dehydrogenase NAD-binding domain-containing protein n=1 Tax=Acinetobacter rathckeae TaxID=2605272 RepID=UPI0018A309E0|nr:3-hydroxyacyl-CoA dehydrogenase NAD-binding domain-containing protein [Acinetobacter rathckeae]MBF7688365.1 hypothetical protein [Acinetobacter rathckeae]MBF7695450.1 hypothetical protein [Acinetobacter rathckeae]
MIYNGPAISIQRLEQDIAALRFKVPQDNTTLFHSDFFNDLDNALNCLDNERHISGLLLLDLHCSFSTLCQYYQQQLQTPCSEEHLTHFQTQLNRIEDYSFPTVALIEQQVFGPAAEIALCSDYRICTHQAQLFLAAPSFGQSLNLGASVRLPRLIGLEPALDALQQHSPYTATKLLHLGLADAQITTDDTLNSAVLYLQLKQQQPKPFDKTQPIQLSSIAQFMIFDQARAQTYQQKPLAHYPAYKILLDTLEQSVNLTRSEAQQLEQQAYLKINNTWQAQALTTQYCSQYLTQQHQSEALHTVACVVNSYQPWLGHLLKQGLQVYVEDTGQDFNHSTFEQALEKAHITSDRSGQTIYTRYTPLNPNIEYVFDLVAENLNTKVARLKDIQTQVAKNSVVLVNSPILSAQTLAEQLDQPEHVLVMHQFTSPHHTPLVELVTHTKVSQDTLTQVSSHLQQLGQMPILVSPQMGLFSQHILTAYITILSDLIHEGIDFACIDHALQEFGFLEGPAALIDRVGLKQYVAVEKNVRGKQAIIPKPIQHLVEQGHLGKVHGFGFYRYDNSAQKAQTNHTVYDVLYGEQPFHVVENEYIIDRVLITLCNATLHAITQGIIKNAQQADLALVHGFGFPDIYVGPCYYIQHIGLEQYIALCNRYAHLGESYHAPAEIQHRLSTQQLFYTQGVV